MDVSRGFMLFVIGALGALSLAIVWPFRQYLLLAVLIAYLLTPVYRRLAPFVGGTGAALALMGGATGAVILPFAALISFVASDALDLAQRLSDSDIELAEVEAAIADSTGREVDLSTTLGTAAENFASVLVGSASDLVGVFTHAVIGITLSAFLLFFFLRDGRYFTAWLFEVTPLPDGVLRELSTNVDDLMWAVLVGHVLVSAIQGLLAGIGLAVTGIPNALFWTFVMMLLALLPVVGAFLVWGPAAAYLVALGDPVAGGALFLYGATVVGLSDNYLRSILVDRRARLNPATIMLGVVGGLYLLGVMGLFFGPVIVGAFKIAIETFDEYYVDR
ncbi:AI-2E family transporter [Halalkalicoccus sp. NIPERK01]|uniref:AI-2E family transporter n=1 Tax=Halalkalicoccus sp. NIPERK01 TaxID=3053469 RepID=UPI00256EFE9B|nr:AI-2E family transporter [Halalkalicoccus sp. NIPERK01]MDL5362707.1 AI-2E family transporter [Halalkalicoccus sp. NIPERK01]